MKSENDTELRGMASTVAEIITKKKLSPQFSTML